jgi:hypothetical protein
MSFIDELTRRISTEVQRTLDSAIRNAIEAYIVDSDEGTPSGATAPTRKRRSTKKDLGLPGLLARSAASSSSMPSRR